MEFALILPLLLLLALGIIEAGRMLAIYSSLSSASKQAARYGSVSGDSQPGLAGEQPFYLDCLGMKQHAINTSLFVGLDADDIAITYDRGSTDQYVGRCALGDPTPTLSETIQDGYRVIISITTIYRPVVPIVPLPDIPINFAAARTIFTTIVGPTNTPRPNPDLSVIKTGSPAIVPPNGEITYWITATNSADSVVANGVTVTDTLPAAITLTQDDLDDIADESDWTCTFLVSTPPQQIRCTRLAPLSGGQSAGFSFTAQPTTSGSITNVVVVGNDKPEDPSTMGNNSAQVTNQVLAGGDLQPSITVAPEGVVGGGALLTYNMWVTNNGPQLSDTRFNNGHYIWMTATLPSGVLPYQSLSVPSDWFCSTLTLPDRIACRYQEDLDPGESTPSVTLVITAPTVAGTITTTVQTSPSALTQDPIPDNNTASVGKDVTTEADLSITKLGSTTANGGGNLLYTLRATNSGPSVATNVRIVDTVPGTIISLNAGSGWNCTQNGTTVSCVRTSLLAVGATTSDIAIGITVPNNDISNTAVVSSDMPDPDPADNSATVNTAVTVCNPGRAHAPTSTISASPGQVQANGTSVSQVTVTLKDMCGAAATDNQTVTLNSSRGGADTITLAGWSSNPTTTGTVVFEVKSSTPGTSTYSASALNNANSETVNLTATADVTFFNCMSVAGQFNQASNQQYVDFRLTNSTDRAWKLTNLTIDWPHASGRRIQQVVIGTSPSTTLWSGNSQNDPFSLPGSAAWDANTDAARTINAGVSGHLLRLHFSFVTPGQQFALTATWDDGNGNTCSNANPIIVTP